MKIVPRPPSSAAATGVRDLSQLVDALARANDDLVSERERAIGEKVLPSREALEKAVADFRAAFFPAHFGAVELTGDGLRRHVASRLERAFAVLEEQVHRALRFAAVRGDGELQSAQRRAFDVIDEFARRLPTVRTLLASDVRAAFEGDPAAKSADEAVFCYPGIEAITLHRIAHELHDLGIPLIPRIVSEIAHARTGIDIHPGARIGGSFFIDHGTGVVIGETAVIGERVRIYQGVTLGARSFSTDEHGRLVKGMPRHPIVGDDVTIYAGATILGRITIGRGSSIGGNVWLTRAVPPGSIVSQVPARDDLFDGGAGI